MPSSIWWGEDRKDLWRQEQVSGSTSRQARRCLAGGQAEGPLAPILAALGYRVTVHEEQRKIYVYPEKRP